MDYVIAICGFLGGWLLVIGPLWQAVIELEEQELDQEVFEQVRQQTEVRPRSSAWWWLLPPVAWAKEMRRSGENRRAFQAALPPEQLKQSVSFLNKANGWFIVAVGAYLFAVKETWELVEVLGWPVWVFWVLVVVLPILAIANAALRLLRSKRVLELGDDAKPKTASEPD